MVVVLWLVLGWHYRRGGLVDIGIGQSLLFVDKLCIILMHLGGANYTWDLCMKIFNLF
jgi:hypothetical protein